MRNQRAIRERACPVKALLKNNGPGILKAVPAPISPLASLTYNREPVMLALKNCWKTGPSKESEAELLKITLLHEAVQQ